MSVVETYTVIHCGECGVPFALNDAFIGERRKDHKTWYCPNGHSRYYPEKNDTEVAKAEVAQLERQLASKDEVLRSERKSHAVTKGKLTRAQNRLIAESLVGAAQ